MTAIGAAVRNASRAPLARAMLAVALVLLLQIPSCMIGQLGKARQQSRDTAAAELARNWGGAQSVLGPFLVVPYRIMGKDAKGQPMVQESGDVVLAPESLEVSADARAEVRRRGLFELPVYRSKIRLTGRFRAPAPELAAIVPADALEWDRAQVALRLGDVHAIDRVSPLEWGGRAYAFEAGGGHLCASGIHAPIAKLDRRAPMPFALTLELRGSGGLQFAPVARQTRVALHSDWPHPSFNGAWLPLERTVEPSGFTARWEIPDVARGLPAACRDCNFGGEDSQAARFGVDLLSPVDPYTMSERSLKYCTLFIGLTFLVLWLFEVIGQRQVYAIQYLLLGAALCLFYLLELSLAEHLGFATAYLIASVAVTVQVVLYARAALSGWRPALALCATVAGLYGLLFVLLRLEDYALLVGSTSLFAILSAVMYLTRSVRWGGDSTKAPAAQ